MFNLSAYYNTMWNTEVTTQSLELRSCHVQVNYISDFNELKHNVGHISFVRTLIHYALTMVSASAGGGGDWVPIVTVQIKKLFYCSINTAQKSVLFTN